MRSGGIHKDSSNILTTQLKLPFVNAYTQLQLDLAPILNKQQLETKTRSQQILAIAKVVDGCHI